MLNHENVMMPNRHNQALKIGMVIFLFVYIAVFAGKLPKFIFDRQALLIFQAVAYGTLCIGGIFLFRNDLIKGMKNWKSSPLKNVLWLVGAFIAGSLLTNIAIYPAYIGGYEDLMGNNMAVLMMVKTIGKPLAILVIGFAGPIVEECVYRGFLIGKIKTKIPLWLCVILSSILFALVHLNGFSIGNFLCVLPGFATGLIYGYVYAKTGNITLPIIMHIASNEMGIMMI